MSASSPRLLLVIALLASCTVVPSATPVPATSTPAPGTIAFEDVAQTTNGNYDGGAGIIVGNTPAAEGAILRTVPGVAKKPGKILVLAMQGSQRTGGYAIAVTKIERDADRLVVHASFTVPAPGAIVTQVLTAPAHVVAILPADLQGAKLAVLVDATGSERSRTTLP